MSEMEIGVNAKGHDSGHRAAGSECAPIRFWRFEIGFGSATAMGPVECGVGVGVGNLAQCGRRISDLQTLCQRSIRSLRTDQVIDWRKLRNRLIPIHSIYQRIGDRGLVLLQID